MAAKRSEFLGVRLRPREIEALRTRAEDRGETLAELVRAQLAPLLGVSPLPGLIAMASDEGATAWERTPRRAGEAPGGACT